MFKLLKSVYKGFQVFMFMIPDYWDYDKNFVFLILIHTKRQLMLSNSSESIKFLG
jgi:hypothetical protein